MNLQSEIAATMGQGDTSGEFTLTILFREVHEGSETYFVAECLEMPGCISQGSTKEEAETNIEDAMRLCLSVMFEDCMKRVMCQHRVPDLTNVSSQRRLNVDQTLALQYA